MSQFITDSHIINGVPVVSPSDSLARTQGKPTSRIRLRDSRELYLLIGECRALGADGFAWRRLLVQRLHQVLDADIVSFVDCRVVGDPGISSDWLLMLSTVDHCNETSVSESPLPHMVDEIRNHRHLSRAVYDYQGAVVANSNATLLSVDWSRDLERRSNAYRAEAGQSIFGINRTSNGNLQLLYISRQPDKSCFSRRAVNLLRALWVELRRFQPDELRTVESSVFMNYPRRMLQVLSCLLAGSTAKETAALLSISVHTVQEHVKRLYKRTSTSNRAELADFFRDVAPQLLETPLDQFP